MLVDSHCHFDLLNLEQDSIDAVIARAKQQGVQYFLNVCVAISEFHTVLKTAEKYDCVSTSIGMHPNQQEPEVDVETLVRLGGHDKVVAVGETGLDYFRSEGDLEWQRLRFRHHIQAARSLKKPLIIHTRQAIVDTLQIMQQENVQDIGGVMHCFSEDWEIAKRCMDMGFYISISGVVTFKNAHTLQEVAKHMPLDRLLIETDSPYLAPVPYRGKQNEPSFVRQTAEFIANLKGISLAELATATSQNFFNLFKGAPRPHV